MAVLAIFMLAGFICQRIKLLPDSTATVLSRLETYLIMPAYILNTFISNCTPEILSERLPLLMWGAIVAVLSVAIAYPVGRAFSKEQPLKNIYRYSVAIANAGFMGNAVMLGVFGEEMLFNYMIFMMPLYVVIYSWGMVMLMPAGGERKNPLKNLINPVCISLVLGMLLGILSIPLPGFVTTVLSNTGSCMAPLAMLLTGFTIGTYSLKKLVADKKVYIISVLRLLVIPAFFALVLGLLKMDFLGLKTLSIIKEAVENIRLSRNVEVDVDAIDISDPATYKLYSDGRTIGTFQFESAGMQKYLRELQPSTFEDLIAMNALYRPGPMDYIPDFIDRKHGRKPIEYDIPVMEKYLKDTYGITVYQEQVMLLSRLLADFTRGESDALRKAMGKKLRDKLDHMKPKFIEGGRKNGHDPKVLEKIWTDWEKFASYAFNKSHATCYSWVAYQTAYLKANYPPEYMAAVMSRSLSNITDITKLMDECKAMGIQTLGPDVNESNLKFTVNHDGDIRFGLGAVKGVGEAAVQSIMEERRKNGPFLGIFDFVQRVNLNACNKKNMECLALAGGFDSFPELKREQYFAVNSKGEVFLETLMRYGNRYQADKAAAVNSLFGGENVIDVATPEIPQGVERWSDLDRLNRERDLVGIYLSAHPLDEFSIVLEHVCNTRMADLEDKAALVGREITMGGIVTSVRRGVSKNGNPYGIAKIEDYSGSTEIPFWGNDWVTYQGYLNEGTFLYIKARCQAKQWRQDELEVKITSMELLPDVKEELVQKITIIIPLSVLNSALVTELATLTKEHPGNTELYFKVTDDADVSHMSIDLISRPIKLSVGRDLITYLKERPELGFHIN